jgi:hypothetical protein
LQVELLGLVAQHVGQRAGDAFDQIRVRHVESSSVRLKETGCEARPDFDGARARGGRCVRGMKLGGRARGGVRGGVKF